MRIIVLIILLAISQMSFAQEGINKVMDDLNQPFQDAVEYSLDTMFNGQDTIFTETDSFILFTTPTMALPELDTVEYRYVKSKVQEWNHNGDELIDYIAVVYLAQKQNKQKLAVDNEDMQYLLVATGVEEDSFDIEYFEQILPCITCGIEGKYPEISILIGDDGLEFTLENSDAYGNMHTNEYYAQFKDSEFMVNTKNSFLYHEEKGNLLSVMSNMETLVSQMEYEAADGSTQKSKYFKYPVELSRPITLDGKFEEKAWNKDHKFNKRPLHAYLYGERCTKNDLSANYQIAWNKDNLYFALDIQDDKLVPISWKDNRAVGDFVQLDLDFETELMKTGALAEEFSKKHVSLAIGFFDREGNAKVYDLNSGKEVEGVGVAYSKTNTGYAVEIELPSKTIKTILNQKRMKNPLRSGKDILFTISVADADVIESGEAQHVKASASMDETKPFQAGRISLYRKYKTKNLKSIITNK